MFLPWGLSFSLCIMCWLLLQTYSLKQILTKLLFFIGFAMHDGTVIKAKLQSISSIALTVLDEELI